MNFIIKNQDTSRYLRLGYIGFALVVALLYDLFFWNKENGIAFPIFVVIYLVGFLLLTVLTNQFRQRWTLLLLIPILVLSIDVVLYNNDLVHYLVTKVVFLLSVIFSLLATLDNPHKHPFSFGQIPLLSSIDLPFTKWGQMYKDLFSWNEAKDKDVARKIATGLVISIPVLFIFAMLFMQADAVFSQWLGNIFNFTNGLSITWVWRIFRAVVFTIFIGSFFYCIFSSGHVLGHKETSVFKLDKIIIGIVLGLINALFLVFVFIQFKYLFGSSSFVLQNGLTYADYARKGFFQLAAVVALAALLIIAIYRSFVHHGVSKLITLLQTLLIAQVAVIAISALKRMNLYQDAYGFTVLRLYVEWFIYLVLLVLAFTGLSLFFKVTFRKFLYTNLILGVAAFTMVASINVDRMIAKENIRRFLQYNKTVDLSYVAQLSTDILPVFHQLLTQENLQKFSVTEQLYIKDIFRNKVDAVAKRDSWQEWHAGDFSNKYFTVPPEATYYDYMNGLQARHDKYQLIESQVAFQDVTMCNRYGSMPVTGFDNTCYPITKDGKNYVYMLSMQKSNPTVPASTVATEYSTNFLIYEQAGPATLLNSYTVVFSKTLPLLSIKQNNDAYYDARYVFFNDGRILERLPEEVRHYAYSVSMVNNRFDLVKSGPLEN
jgi:hypothetical protein